MIDEGFILITKDGRFAGNGIVTKVEVTEKNRIVHFETDFGKTGKLPQEEILRLFRMDADYYLPVREWRERRIANIFGIKLDEKGKNDSK